MFEATCLCGANVSNTLVKCQVTCFSPTDPLQINCLVVFYTVLHMFLSHFYLQTLNILII